MKNNILNYELVLSDGTKCKLDSFLKNGPLMVVFYPGDFTPVCTAQLCDYSENIAQFTKLGITILGVSRDEPHKHVEFKDKHQFPFELATDATSGLAKNLECTSKWMFGKVSRAIVVLSMSGEIIWKYVESTPITRRKASDILDELLKLKEAGKLE